MNRHLYLHFLDLLCDILYKSTCNAYFYSSLDEKIWVLVLIHLLEVKAVLEHHLASLLE